MSDPIPDLFPEPRNYRGQEYRPFCIRTHRRKDGNETLLAIWESECATCGEPFTVATPMFAAKFTPNRRCQRHKRPGQRVGRAGA